MKAKILKILTGAVCVLPAFGTVVQANSSEAVGGIYSVTYFIDNVSGKSGVDWSIGRDNVLRIKAGRLERTNDWQPYKELIRGIRVLPDDGCDKLILPENCSTLFFDFSSVTEIDTAMFDTSSVCSMDSMFGNCSSLKELDLSAFDTSKVTDLSDMFVSCASLQNLDLSGFDTRHVSNLNRMFSGCRSLASLDLSSFDTSGVKDRKTENLFEDCPNLEKINLSKNFFKSDMTGSCPCSEKAEWTQLNHLGKWKTWPEIARSWSAEEAGWWKLNCCHLDFHSDGGTEFAGRIGEQGIIMDLSEYNPSKKGYTFTGWYLDAECTEKAQSLYPLNSDTTLYAGWQIQNRTITFDTQGGQEIMPVTVQYGDSIYLRDCVPVKPGCSFEGWYMDHERLDPAPDQLRMDWNYTVHARWNDPLAENLPADGDLN